MIQVRGRVFEGPVAHVTVKARCSRSARSTLHHHCLVKLHIVNEHRKQGLSDRRAYILVEIKVISLLRELRRLWQDFLLSSRLLACTHRSLIHQTDGKAIAQQ